MVTAGVYLIARMSPILRSRRRARLVTFIGASTALFAATIGCAQTDSKRVIAYSTCQQLGYMFIAARRRRVPGVDLFHLITHAFFKALLFLAAPARSFTPCPTNRTCARWAGCAKLIPWTCAVMWIGALALAGIPPFAAISRRMRSSPQPMPRYRHRHVRSCPAPCWQLPHGVLLMAPAVHDVQRQLARRSPCPEHVHEARP